MSPASEIPLKVQTLSISSKALTAEPLRACIQALIEAGFL